MRQLGIDVETCPRCEGKMKVIALEFAPVRPLGHTSRASLTRPLPRSTGPEGFCTTYRPITHGFNSTDDAGYRSALFKLVVAANQNVTFIGSLSNGPSTVSGKTFPKNHEGHDGITVTGITGYVPPSKAFTTTPHIVLLHIGTNDMTSNADPTTTANQLDTLVTNLVAAAPNALIVVAKIVPLGYTSTNYNSYVAKIPDVVKAHAAKNQNVIMVEMSTPQMLFAKEDEVIQQDARRARG
jgi:hypothetical protein